MQSIDINCDMGEHFGVYRIPVDEDRIMQAVDSINIACGFHAGDPHVMHETVAKAIKYQLKIGAHPGLNDLQGFGRRAMALTAREVYEIILYQIGALNAFVNAKGAKLHHVKPHGALYNQASKDKDLASAIAQAVYDFDSSLILYGLSGSELIKEGKIIGLQVANEVFADRTYQIDGSLTPRTQKNCFIESVEQSLVQVLMMVKHQKVSCVTGEDIPIVADTVCIHSDTENVLKFAETLAQSLADVQ
jgi:5-oxoprolinase (ATP-hydrolysing) subunit A